MKRFAKGLNAPPPPEHAFDEMDEVELRDMPPMSQASSMNSSEEGSGSSAATLLRPEAEDSAPGILPPPRNLGRTTFSGYLGKGKGGSPGSLGKSQSVRLRQSTQPSQNGQSVVDVPTELPTFASRPLRSQNMSHSLVMCMDPNCTSCPPELHAHRRRLKIVPQPESSDERSNIGGRTMKEEIDAVDSDEEEEPDSVMGMVKRKFKALYKPQEEGPSQFKQTVQEMIRGNVINPNNHFVKNWNQFFFWSMFIAFAVDPLFFFVTSVDSTSFCVYTSWSFVYILSALRTVTDFIYFLHMLMQFRVGFFEPAATVKRFYWIGRKSSSLKPGQLVLEKEEIRDRYLKGWFCFDCFGVLPIPQIMAMAVIPAITAGPASVGANFLRACVLMQYIPRIRRCWTLVAGTQATGLLFESAWASFVLNLVMFMMASHVLGSVWYLSAVQRWESCATGTCQKDSEVCNLKYLNCQNGARDADYFNTSKHNKWVSNTTNLTATCVVNPGSGTTPTFNYGLFQFAIPLVFQTDVFTKYIYSLQWGFTQTSTLGGNQVPSYFVPEILLMIYITASGLLLFAVLIGNIQNFLQALTRRTFEYQLHRRDVENWMTRRNLDPKLARRVRTLERLQWVSNQGVDEQEVLGTLTEDLQRDVRRALCLELIEKCKLFSAMDEATKDFICERLKHRVYIDDTAIIRQNYPVTRMFFILGGELSSVTTTEHGTSSQMLTKGDFFGEELLIAYLEITDQFVRNRSSRRIKRNPSLASSASSLSFSGTTLEVYPSSERTIACAGPVEGFILEAQDLEYMCKQFGQVLRQRAVQGALNECSPSRRLYAAVTIQLRIRAHLRRKLKLNLEHCLLALKEKRLGQVMKYAIENPGRQPREVRLNPIYAPIRPPARGIYDVGPLT